MTREGLLALHARVCDAARSLMSRKNQDYGGDDVMGNLRLIEQLFPSDTIEKGIVIRMGDKLSRLAVLTRQDPAVVDEKIEDTCHDLINYAILLLAAHSLREEGKPVPARSLFDQEAVARMRETHEARAERALDKKENPKKGTNGYPPGW